MSSPSAPQATGFVPVLRYRDVGRAADWLCRAFGFARDHEVTGDDGIVIYAQLKCGPGLIMLVPEGESELDRLMCQPSDTGGLETQVCYVVVDDAARHCVAAAEAGARIVLALATDDKGGAGYSCRDLEGHVWSFGTYDPARSGSLTPPAVTDLAANDDMPPPPRRALEPGAPAHRTGSSFAAVAAAFLLAVVAGGAGLLAAFNGALNTSLAPQAAATDDRADSDGEIGPRLTAALADAKRAAEERAQLAAELAGERKARQTAEAAAAEATIAARAEKEKAATLQLSVEADAQKAEDALTQARTQRATAELERSRLEHQLEAEKREHERHIAELETLTDRLATIEREKAQGSAGSPGATSQSAAPQSGKKPAEGSSSADMAAAPASASPQAAEPSPAALPQDAPAHPDGSDAPAPPETGSIEDKAAGADGKSPSPVGSGATDAAAGDGQKPADKSKTQKAVRAAKPANKSTGKQASSGRQPQVLEPVSKQWPYEAW